MNILFFSHDSAYYGAPQALFELVTSLEQYGLYKCIVITPQYGLLNEKLSEVGIENYIIKYFWSVAYQNDGNIKRVLKYFRSSIYSHLAIKKIKKILNMDSIDVVHTNSSVIDIGAKVSRKFKKIHVWHIREMLEEHYGFRPLIKEYIKFIEENSNVVVVISNAIKNGYENKGLKQNVRLVYDGLDTKLSLESNKVININNNKIKCVFVGQICELKGQFSVVQAVALLPEKIRNMISVDFYGDFDKPYFEIIENYIEKNNYHDNFNFLGYSNQIKDLLWEYDIGFVCSKFEGFGRSTVEYMLAEVCPIVSDTGANPELVKDGYNGFVYKYGDIQELSCKIEYIASKPEKLKEVSKIARYKALNELSLSKSIKQMDEIFKMEINRLK